LLDSLLQENNILGSLMDILELLRDVVFYLGLMTPQCFEDVVVKLNFGNVLCLKSTLSKVLGLGIVVGSSLVKLPQVLKIYAGKSAVGISFLSVLLELLAVTFSGVYGLAKGFPFGSYGESLFLAIQTAIIGLLVLWYGGKKMQALVFMICYSALVFAGLKLVPVHILWYGQATNIPMVVIGKFIQIITNFNNGHTGQLSAVTVFLIALGSVARIFTSIQETGDQVLILTFVCSTVVNGIIAAQVLWYWNSDKKKTA